MPGDHVFAPDVAPDGADRNGVARRVRPVQLANVLLMVVGLYACLFALPNGEALARPFLGWMESLRTVSVWDAYTVIEDQYGPLTYLILAWANYMQDASGAGPYDIFKYVQLAFAALSIVVLAAIERDVHVALVFGLVSAVNNIVFANIDVYFTPTLILALWWLSQGRYGLFSVTFAVTCLIKYQPLIFAPIIAVCIGRRVLVAWRVSRRVALSVVAASVLPALLIIVIVTVLFGPLWLESFGRATAVYTSFMSAATFNIHWLFSFVLQLIDGRLAAAGGLTAMQGTTALDVFISRVAFIVAAGLLMWLYVRRRDTPAALFGFCALVLLAYIQVSTNVHINHSFAALVALALLTVVRRTWQPLLVFWGAMLSVNLLLVVGFVDNRLVFGVDLTIPLTLLGIAGFVLTVLAVMKETRPVDNAGSLA